MLNLILNRSNAESSNFIYNLAVKKANFQNEHIILLVPTSNVYSTKKSLLNLADAKVNSKIKVMDFKGLINVILTQSPQNQHNVIDENERFLLMEKTIKSVEDDILLYKNIAQSGKLTALMIQSLTELCKNNISTNDLSLAEKSLPLCTLKTKLQEILLIFKNYQAQLGNDFFDPLNSFQLACEILSTSAVFNNSEVLIDSFNDFNTQELKLIKSIITSCPDCYINLTSDNPFQSSRFDLFSSINKIIKNLKDFADLNNVQINLIEKEKDITCCKSDELNHLEENIFRSTQQEFKNPIKNIQIFNAKDIYSEVEFIAHKIKSLAGNYTYDDILIVTNDFGTYENAIKSTFEKYNIPIFTNSASRLISPIFTLVLSLLEIVITNFSNKSVFSYLKSGFSSLSTSDIAILENYVFLWNIPFTDWSKPFTYNPQGNKKLSTETTPALEKLNFLREKVFRQILKFSNKMNGKNASEITAALYDFLCDTNVPQTAQNLSCTMDKALSDNLKRSWNLLINIFDQIVSVFKDQKISIEKYYNVLVHLINSCQTKPCKKSLNSINITSVNKLNSLNSKITFILGCTSTDFLTPSKELVLFTDNEKNILNKLNLIKTESLEDSILKNRFLIYKALTSSSEMLYISWSNYSNGKSNLPSEIIKEITQLFPKIVIADEYSFCDQDKEIFTEKQALNLCAKTWHDDTTLAATLKKFFITNPKYKSTITSFKKAGDDLPIAFENPDTIKNLFSNTITLSASQIEKYYLCPFQFFCKYCLLVAPKKTIAFDFLEYGSLMHFILEKVISQYTPREILSMGNSDLTKIIKNLIFCYISTHAFFKCNNDKRNAYLISRVASTAAPLITHIAAELSQSEFIATDFELSFSDKSKIKPLCLPLSDDKNLLIEGKIDRVDIMRKNNKNYIRVIDYKTGTKELKFYEVIQGLNLQLLLYLLTISKSAVYKEAIPAGALYMPAIKPTITANKSLAHSKIKSQKAKKLRMNGLILALPEVIFGMEKEANGEFIPAIIKDGNIKKSDSVLSSFEMQALLNYVEKMVIKVAQSLTKGLISPLPAKNECNACEFCDYSSICCFNDRFNVRNITKATKDELMKKIKEQEEF